MPRFGSGYCGKPEQARLVKKYACVRNHRVGCLPDQRSPQLQGSPSPDRARVRRVAAAALLLRPPRPDRGPEMDRRASGLARTAMVLSAQRQGRPEDLTRLCLGPTNPCRSSAVGRRASSVPIADTRLPTAGFVVRGRVWAWLQAGLLLPALTARRELEARHDS